MPSVRIRDAVALALFSLLWLLPVTYHGFSGGQRMPGWPVALVHLTSISCLFKSSYYTWPSAYVEARFQPGGPWVTLDESEHFQMLPFGYRNRFDEMLLRQLGDRSVHEALSWLRRRHAEKHPEQGLAVAMRVVSGHFQVGDPIPVGRWRKPAWSEVPPDRRKAWVEVQFPPEPAATPPAPGTPSR